MVREISYNDLANVVESWEKLRTKRNFEQEAGDRLYKNFFNRCPEAKPLFGLTPSDTPNLPVLADGEKFARQGLLMIQMIDVALSMVGPDMDSLTEMLLELGVKHEHYGVKAEMYPLMQLALCDAMEEMLSDTVMTPEVKESWKTLLGALAEDMVTTQDVSWRAGAYDDH